MSLVARTSLGLFECVTQREIQVPRTTRSDTGKDSMESARGSLLKYPRWTRLGWTVLHQDLTTRLTLRGPQCCQSLEGLWVHFKGDPFPWLMAGGCNSSLYHLLKAASVSWLLASSRAMTREGEREAVICLRPSYGNHTWNHTSLLLPRLVSQNQAPETSIVERRGTRLPFEGKVATGSMAYSSFS